MPTKNKPSTSIGSGSAQRDPFRVRWLLLVAACAIHGWAQTAHADAPATQGRPGAPSTVQAAPASRGAESEEQRLLGAPADPGLRLRRGLQAFEYGNFVLTVRLLRPLIEEDRLRGADRLQALRAYGVALFLLGRRGGAEAAFLLLLSEDPSARLDPALVPPEVIAFLDEIRLRHQAAIEKAARRKRPSAWVNMLPPWGQFQNGHRAKGAVLLSLEATFLTVNLATYAAARSMRRSDGTVASEGRFDAAKTANIASFCLLLGTLVYGVVDGFYYFSARERAIVGVGPTVWERGAGLGAVGRF